jgi:hypothetical protein
MKLNLPILDQLDNSRSILIAGAGGGFDVFAGLPVCFALREMGKTVYLANYSFTELTILSVIAQPEVMIDGLLVGTKGDVIHPFPYYPEGYLAEWFRKTRGEDVTVWMFARTGVQSLHRAYRALVSRLNIDAILLVDGGVDSIMRGDEQAPGTLVEDSITLAAIEKLDVPVKLLACLGFGAEVEEGVCHHHALENIAALAKAGGFLGSCALTPQMPVFEQYEAACRYVWEQPSHSKSHISTRIIPAVHGEFGNYHMYPEGRMLLFISPLMSLYWFFDAHKVVERSLLIPRIRDTDGHETVIAAAVRLGREGNVRPRQSIPY